MGARAPHHPLLVRWAPWLCDPGVLKGELGIWRVLPWLQYCLPIHKHKYLSVYLDLL